MKAAIRLLALLALVAPAFVSAQSTTAPAPTCTLHASAATVAPNTRVRLDWTSKNASAGYLTEIGPIPSSGFGYVVPGKNTTYAASFTGPGGSVVCRVGVAVSAPPVSGGGGGTVNTGGTITNPPVNLPNVTLPTAQNLGLTSPTGNGFVGGIVPLECRGKSTIANCDLCSLAQLIQNIANFLLGLSVPAAALLFAWAGIRLFAARGVPEHINAAKKIFMTVLIGFLIIVSAWALINTALQMLLKGGQLSQWNWRTLDCTTYRAARLYNMSIKEYLQTSLPTLSGYSNVAPASDPIYNTPLCPSGSTFQTSLGGCMDNATNECTYSDCGVTPGAGIPAAQQCPSGSTYSSAIGGCTDNTTGECTYQNCGVSVVSGSAAQGGISGSFTSCPAGYSYASDEGGYCQNPNNSGDWVEACPTGYVFTAKEGGYCEDPRNPNRWVEVDGTGGSGASLTAASRSARAAEFNNQLSTACAQRGLDCDIPTRLAMNESSGGRNCSTSSTGAAGCMQVLATTACGVDSSISDACAACSASRQSLSTQCAPVIQAIRENQQMGVNLGVQYISNLQNMPALQRYQSQYGECQVTAAAYYAGPGAVIQAGGNINNVRVPPGAPSASSYVATACR